MKSYNNFLGIDIGKKAFVVAIHGEKTTKEYGNDATGIACFIKEKKSALSSGLCVVETTGGHEMRLLLNLCDAGFSAHRAPGRKIKNFIRSYGNEAKTDEIDAKALARYAQERFESLELFIPPSQNARQLYELAQRRNDIKQMLVMEKCRLQAPRVEYIKESIEEIIQSLKKSLDIITQKINELIETDKNLKEKKRVLLTVSGIGNIIANELLILVPELGSLNRREIASLVGVAPIARDSGQLKGYRRTGHGRGGIKPSLFLAAMAARQSKTSLKTFYESLIARGKKKMVALTALMRKIIVIANARLKEMAAA